MESPLKHSSLHLLYPLTPAIWIAWLIYSYEEKEKGEQKVEGEERGLCLSAEAGRGI